MEIALAGESTGFPDKTKNSHESKIQFFIQISYRHNDVLIKAGEWRLGSDEEPKPFQIVRVKKIVFHPQFKRDTLEHDIALLHLENDIRYDSHIGPICLDDVEANTTPNDNCVTTGWGKEVLKGNFNLKLTPL